MRRVVPICQSVDDLALCSSSLSASILIRSGNKRILGGRGSDGPGK